ncbi:GatB/YqeY domain-containing protein [bacterium]|nr:GatB/YqeY domain-containing protein [bacterium]
MGLEQKIFDDLKTAMKAGEKDRVNTLRMIRSQIKNVAIAKSDEITDDDVLSVLNKEAKKRKESVSMYQDGGREDLAQIESTELKIISAYLPEELSAAEIAELVDGVINKTGAKSIADMGRVMGQIMSTLQGRADGKLVQQIVRERLGS